MTRRVTTARDQVAMLAPWREAAVTQDLVDRLHGEFHQWWHDTGYDEIQKGQTDSERGPIQWWPNVEEFLSDKYPAAHRDLDKGYEEARTLLDHGRMYPEGHPLADSMQGYETGPEAVAEHGYDPKEIAAGMLLLHNKAHPFRGELSQQDQDRLTDIAQKRFQMQRDYEQRQTTARLAAQDSSELATDYTNQLHDEFHDWAKGADWLHGSDPADTPDYTKPMGGPLCYWENVEKFLKDRYPAAHRDYHYGEEEVSRVLDNKPVTFPPKSRGMHPQYETGPEATAKHGYDPKQVAAGMMYLHSWSHSGQPSNYDRHDLIPRDINRLTTIFDNRQQMQRSYEHRQTTAAVNQNLVDRLHGEFHQWWDDKQANDPDPSSADYWKSLDGGVTEPIQYWPHIEEFLSHRYPAAHRDHEMGLEEAGHILDGHEPMPYQVQSGMDTTPYATGPEAVAQHGYDPKEIAAGMLLLHNKAHFFRGDMSEEDQARLNDIFTKRQQMQRDYEQRQTTAGRRPDPTRPMGVNINDTHQDYTGQILRGEKTIETRNTASLHPYVGRRIAIYRTDKRRRNNQKTPTLVVGHATVGEPIFYPDAESFDSDYHRHLVAPDSREHITSPANKTGTKYGYPMLDPVALDKPMLVLSKGIVARGAEETDFAPYDGPWPL